MTTPAWPAVLLPSSVMFHPMLVSKGGGVSLDGDEQVSQSDAGRWKATLAFSASRQVGADPAARLLAWRSLLAYLQGRANPILIGPFDAANGPAKLAGGSATTATASGGAALRATSMNVAVSTYTPRPGQYFGVASERLHLIALGGVTALGGGVFTVAFWPPLRAAVGNGAAIDFDTPVCKMALASDDSGQLALERAYRGQGSFDLYERA